MEAARRALGVIATELGWTVEEVLGWTVEEVADGAIRVASALMAAEASNVLARRGVDPPEFRMVAFGGAGPLIGALLAEEIAIDTVLIPPYPGALSALGAACADLEGDLVQPIYERLGEIPAATLAAACQMLEKRGQEWLSEQTASLVVTEVRVEIAADMRYDGQGYDVTVPLVAQWLVEGDFDRLRAAFHKAHRATYGHANEAAEIWLKELRAHIIGVTKKPRIVSICPTSGSATATCTFRLFGREFAATVYECAGLCAGQRISGPAIVNQMDTTSLIPELWQAHTVASGALVLERSADGGGGGG